jgi:hypothetical protein
MLADALGLTCRHWETTADHHVGNTRFSIANKKRGNDSHFVRQGEIHQGGTEVDPEGLEAWRLLETMADIADTAEEDPPRKEVEEQARTPQESESQWVAPEGRDHFLEASELSRM